ncbi:MAG: DUF4139 domain-containing protein [Methanomassiliicoccaceae archaeon]|jgi:uncharacterized protein (TIGR02231 family)|nr:DUF4139 domain-containing protein [Methanomassiliicoccaceae archaeon]
MSGNITQAVVYLNGAQITRSQTFELKKGTDKVLFKDLPLNINGQSITASSDGKCTILSVTHNTVYAKAGDKRTADLYVKLRKLKEEMKLERGIHALLTEEEALIRKNTQMTDGKRFRAEDMKNAVGYFRERMASLCAEKLDVQKRIDKLSEEISALESQIGMDDRDRQRSQVEIEAHCDNDAGSENTISYFTHNAGWEPYYDVRVKDVASPLSVASKASVYQSTGEDWNAVNIVLSTGNPSLGGYLPELMPWYINFYEPQVARHRAEFNVAKRMNTEDCAEYAEEECLAAPVCAPVTVQTENVTSVEFALPVPYSVPSSGDGKAVDILTHEVKAEYVYKSIRKIEKDVFLIANVKGWEHLNLLAGKANIFFEDRYVGEVFIDPRLAEKGLQISLGRDKNVVVTRVRGKDFAAPSMLGPSTKVSREWTLNAKNLRKQKIDMVIEDQIPVSVDKGITVDAVTISGAEHEKETGKLTWKFSLGPAETKTIPVKYSVSYPKSRTVILE